MAEKAVFISKRFSELKVVYKVGGDEQVLNAEGMTVGEFKNQKAKHVQFEKHKFETSDPVLISILEKQPSFDSPEMRRQYPHDTKMYYRLNAEEMKVINDTHLIMKQREEIAVLQQKLRDAEEIAFPGDTAPPIIDGARGTGRAQQARAASHAAPVPETAETPPVEEKVAQEPPETPSEPNPFLCPVPGCGFIGKSKQSLRMHMTKKHPQGRKR